MSGRSLEAIAGSLLVLMVGTACTDGGPTQPTGGNGALQTPAVGSAANGATAENTRIRTPIAFTLSGCSNLPAGLTVSGSGESFLVTNSRIDPDGVTYIERNDLVIGTATDSNGASYKFNYHNHSNITIPPGGFPWSFTTTDHFNLVGNGRADQMQVSFVARVTFPSPTDPPLAEFVNSRGNPFFCDPI